MKYVIFIPFTWYSYVCVCVFVRRLYVDGSL